MSEGKAITDKMEAAWKALDELCSTLTDEQWKLPTECPGWSVQDNLAHISGTEGGLLGRPQPEHSIPDDLPHVKNPIGKSNEVQVDYRRSWAPSKVLEEFREITGARIAALRAMTDDDFNKDSFTPTGPGKYVDFMQIRVFDSWVHEQDIRRAIGRPGHVEGPVAQHSYGRITMALPFVVGKKVAPPEGTTVVFDTTGPVGGKLAITVEGGRAKPSADIPASPAVTLTMDLATLNALGCGRRSADQAAGDVTLTGDEALGRKVLEQMNFMI